jgi:hypothetical protein
VNIVHTFVNGVQSVRRNTKVFVMKTILVAALMGSIGLTACDVSHPVAVVGPANTVYRGTATATFLEGGWFQVSNGGTNCSGRYTPASETRKVTFPVKCSNGLTGVGTAQYETPRSGGGEIVMQDGSRWQFIFGRGALSV